MKEHDAKIEVEAHQLLLYVEKDDGSYGSLQTGSYIVGNYFDDYLEKRGRFHASCLKRLISGQDSPVAYYQALCELTDAELARRARIWRYRVRRHRKPEHFASMTVAEAARYADVFNVPLASLFQVVVQPAEGTGRVVHERTDNGPLVVTKYMEQAGQER